VKAAKAAGFEVLVTGDKTLHSNRILQNIALVSLSANDWRIINALSQ
jgi:hypothetical protein